MKKEYNSFNVNYAFDRLQYVISVVKDLYDRNLLKDDEFNKLNLYLSNVEFSLFEDWDRYLHKIVSESDVFNRRYIDYEQSENAR